MKKFLIIFGVLLLSCSVTNNNLLDKKSTRLRISNYNWYVRQVIVYCDNARINSFRGLTFNSVTIETINHCSGYYRFTVNSLGRNIGNDNQWNSPPLMWSEGTINLTIQTSLNLSNVYISR